MKRKGVLSLSASLALLTAFGIAIVLSGHSLTAQTPAPAARGAAQPATAPAARGAAPAATTTPTYRNIPLWPKPLPNFWVFGSISGVTVGADDHIWVVHRGADSLENAEKGMILATPTSSVCCVPAPAVLEFDQNGTVLSAWGGAGLGFAWPQNVGGIAVDSKGNVWVAGFGLEPPPAATGRGRGAPPAAPAAGAPPAGAPPAGGRGARGAAPADGAAPAGGRGARGAPPAGGAPAAAAPAPAAQAPAAAPAGRGAAPAAAPALADSHVTKYNRNGTFLLQIGKPGEPGNPSSQTGLNRPYGIALDEPANEVYISDTGNHRIVVFDMNTGAFKRMWGGSGEAPTAAGAGAYDPNAPVAKQFRDPTCVKIAKDGMVYVCDRTSNRIQVFNKQGQFQKEMVIAKETLGAVITVGQGPGVVTNTSGSVWDVAFSNDAAQRWMFVADGHNHRVLVLNRSTLAQVAVIGTGGRQMGRFLMPASVAVDSKGNLYTGEAHYAKRLQKFTAAAAAAAPAR